MMFFEVQCKKTYAVDDKVKLRKQPQITYLKENKQ